MDIAKIKPDLQIDFPLKVKEWLRTEKELVVLMEGDTLILKKIKSPQLSSIASRYSEKAMPLNQISDEVHEYRKNK